ncbi:MAG TPA: zinc ribbon domain-containing protein [Ktedonobacterales bacterium]|nr:zinc ribbon domain-containing protein [Ktedonobacterales bacterium]
MERCAFCQAALDAETRFCWQCGRARTSMLLVEETSPSLLIVPSARRCVVCGVVLPEEASICGNCLSQQPSDADPAAGQVTLPEMPMKRCAACGEESPLWARFCGGCRQPFAPSSDNLADLTLAGSSPETSSGPGLLAETSSGFASGADAPTLAHTSTALDLETSPWHPGITTPPPEPPEQPASRPRLSGLRVKVIAALLATALVVTTAGATLAYFLTRPEPEIQVVSASMVGKTPAGSPTSTLLVIGQNFTHHSSVTILLDGKATPGARSVPTDGVGSFRAHLTVTEAWRYGLHTLTATDARGYSTRSGVRVDIIPHPVIMVQSQYQQNGVPVGATSTTLHVSGKWFSYRSPITFLVDGQPAPGNQSVQSDAQGNVEADLTVTGDWSQGNHTLTAKDAQGYLTQSAQPFAIVSQGEANIPGPDGAPLDDASFTLGITIQTPDPTTGQPTQKQETLVITGQPDPAGGTVCQAQDNGQPYTLTGMILNAPGLPPIVTYQETLTTTCSGSYKSGQLSYTETVTSDQYVLSAGNLTCQASTPYTLQNLSGAFNSATASNGDWSATQVTITCAGGQTFTAHPAQQGSWTGALQ